MGISLESHVYYSIDIAGKSIPFITDAVIAMWIVTAVIVVSVVLLTRNLNAIPTGRQKVAEAIVEFISNMCREQIGRHYRAFAPFLCTLILFLLVSNMISIFNILPSGAALSGIFNNPRLEHFNFLTLHPPTRNINVTACLAIITVIVVIGAELKYKGPRGWLHSFYKPSPVSGFIKILDYFVRPLSLCLRLFGNVMGGYIAMSLLYSAMPIIVPAFVSLYFDLFDGGLQAYVFVFLSSLYLMESVETEDEEFESEAVAAAGMEVK